MRKRSPTRSTLKDVHYAEEAGLKALKKSAKSAKSDELKDAFQNHGEETARQMERLQEVFEIIGKPARSKTCEAMQGLVSEMEEDLEDFGDSPAADAVLIGCAQSAKHYEIARYGMLRTWARQLGYDDAVKLLDKTHHARPVAHPPRGRARRLLGYVRRSSYPVVAPRSGGTVHGGHHVRRPSERRSISTVL